MLTKEDCLKAAVKSPSVLKVLPKQFQADKDVVRAALVRKFYEYYEEYDTFSVRMFEILKNFKYTDPTLKNDKEFVLELIEKCSGYLYEYLPARLRNDKTILKAVIKTIGIDYIHSKLKRFTNQEIFHHNDVYWLGLENFLSSKNITPFIGSKLLDDRDLMMKVLENEPSGLNYLSDQMKNDKEIALLVLRKSGECFSFISELLMDDMEVVLTAIHSNCKEYFWWDLDDEERWSSIVTVIWDRISERLKNDKNLYLTIINDGEKYYKGEFVLTIAPDSIKDDENVVLAAISIDKTVLQFASERRREKLK